MFANVIKFYSLSVKHIILQLLFTSFLEIGQKNTTAKQNFLPFAIAIPSFQILMKQ